MLDLAFGAHPSPKDSRDHKDKNILAQDSPYPQSFNVDMTAIEVFHQHQLGVCTAAALVVGIIEYLYWKKTGKYVKLSVAFLYCVTKIYIDKNTQEGSSLRSALKAAYKYGVATEATFPSDMSLEHQAFIFQVIPKTAWDEALNYTIGGYMSVPVDESFIAAHIYKHGPVYARFDVGERWFTPSWLEKDLSPLSASKTTISGHAVAITGYDLKPDEKPMWLRNSWGPTWFRGGNGLFNFRDYKPTEVWAVSLDSTMGLDESPKYLDSITIKVLNLLRKIGQIF